MRFRNFSPGTTVRLGGTAIGDRRGLGIMMVQQPLLAGGAGLVVVRFSQTHRGLRAILLWRFQRRVEDMTFLKFYGVLYRFSSWLRSPGCSP
jgi:hypothetical protein